MDQLNDSNVKIAVLEQRVTDFSSFVSKLDTAIEKISEVNNNVSRMLAVHEERITKQEEIDSILFDKIDKLRDKMDSDHDIVAERIGLLEKKLWSAIGILAAVMISINPSTIQKLLPLFRSSSPAIIAPAGSVVNGSNR